MSDSTSAAAPMHPAVAVLSEDRDRISYRPKLNKLTGGVLPTIMLQQVLYWWVKSGRKPFYKFFAPCEHSDYRTGDSWQEELGFSRTEIENSLKRLGTKIKKGVSKSEALENNIIIWWTDRTRKTFYQVNEALLAERLSEVYLCNVENPHYIEMQDSRNTNIDTETNSREVPPTEAANAKANAAESEKPEEVWPGDEAPLKNKQAYFIAYLHRRLKERELLDKPMTPSYRKQLAGEVATHLNKGYGRGRILAGLDYVIFRWRHERVGLAVGLDRVEGQDNVRQFRAKEQPAVSSTAGYRKFR